MKRAKHPLFKLGASLLQMLSFQIVVNGWLNGTMTNFVARGVQVIVQHAFLENVDGDLIPSSCPAHCCLKYLQCMSVDISQCIKKAFDQGVACQDTSGILLSMLESNNTKNILNSNNTIHTDIPNLPVLQSTGGQYYVPK